MGVMVFDMSSFLLQWSAGMDAAILIDDIMVADTIPLTRSMPTVNVGNCHFLTGFGRRAMNDD